MPKIGFTGTQEGMTVEQMRSLRKFLWWMKRRGGFVNSPDEIHLGDCIGADAQAHKLATGMGYRAYGHIPADSSKRAHCEYFHEYKPLPYLERNQAIVRESELLIATPYTQHERIRSGTWSTVRYARKFSKDIFIINPDGGVYPQ